MPQDYRNESRARRAGVSRVGALLLGSGTFVSAVMGGVVLLACVERPLLGDPTGEGSDTGGSGGGETSGVPTSSDSTMPGPDSTGTTSTDTTGTDTTGTGVDTTGSEDTCRFICDPSTSTTGPAPCGVYAQDCPDGEKCMPYAEGGGSSWNNTKCVPVTGDGKAGEPCMTDGGGVSGLDDCAKGVMCWDVDEMNHGLCVEMCTGSESNPMCPEGSQCATTGEGILNLCLPSCDPLVQDCPGDDLCLPYNDTFICVLDGSGADTGKALDPCEFANACDKGHLCLNPSASGKCDANAGGCCMPLCDLADQMAADEGCKAVADDTSCVSLYEEGTAPPDFETVGYCVIPD